MKKRETAMQRQFEESDFKAFVMSKELPQRMPALEETLARWKAADLTRAGNLALAYLPPDANFRRRSTR